MEYRGGYTDPPRYLARAARAARPNSRRFMIGYIALFRSAPRPLLFGAGPGEDSFQTGVPLVAGVLVHMLVGALERNHHRPRPGPRRRIVERHLVLDGRRADASEALGHPHALGGVHQVALRRVVRGFDNERVAFPT